MKLYAYQQRLLDAYIQARKEGKKIKILWSRPSGMATVKKAMREFDAAFPTSSPLSPCHQAPILILPRQPWEEVEPNKRICKSCSRPC